MKRQDRRRCVWKRRKKEEKQEVEVGVGKGEEYDDGKEIDDGDVMKEKKKKNKVLEKRIHNEK